MKAKEGEPLDLVGRAQARDREAFEMLVEQHAAGVYRLAGLAGAVALVAIVAMLLGQGQNVGPGPTSPVDASAEPASVRELRAAVRAAVDVLRQSPGVEGLGTSEVLGELGSASWFGWRPNGDQVVVNRSDVDVTQTGWWRDPVGAPPARGANVTTVIQVLAGNTYYRAAGEVGGEEGWTAQDRSSAPEVLGFPGILDGHVDPWEWVGNPDAEGEASVRPLADRAAEWTLTRPHRTGSWVEEYRIGPDGALRAWTVQLVDVEPTPEDAPLFTSHRFELAPLIDPEPIEAPDVDSVPAPTEFGLPADFPLALTASRPPPGGVGIENDVECQDSSGTYRVALPEKWWTNVAFDHPQLGELAACQYFAPEPFDPATATPDRPIPAGVTLQVRMAGGCIGYFDQIREQRETTIDGHSATITEFAREGAEPDDPPVRYEYVILLEPDVDCEGGGRAILAATALDMAGDYEENKAILDGLMESMEITFP